MNCGTIIIIDCHLARATEEADQLLHKLQMMVLQRDQEKAKAEAATPAEPVAGPATAVNPEEPLAELATAVSPEEPIAEPATAVSPEEPMAETQQEQHETPEEAEPESRLPGRLEFLEHLDAAAVTDELTPTEPNVDPCFDIPGLECAFKVPPPPARLIATPARAPSTWDLRSSQDAQALRDPTPSPAEMPNEDD